LAFLALKSSEGEPPAPVLRGSQAQSMNSSGGCWFRAPVNVIVTFKPLEVVAALLAVLFLKGILTSTENIAWPDDLVVPVGVVLFAATVWLIRKAHQPAIPAGAAAGLNE
jgi:hypothetical protein